MRPFPSIRPRRTFLGAIRLLAAGGVAVGPATWACATGEPPGAEVGPLAREVRRALVVATASGEDVNPTPAGRGGARVEPDVLGTIDDSLPFEPTGERIVSIAWRTWVYTDTGPKRRRYGYLRAGSVVDARGPALTNAGCPGGWYRINPRGFVCVGLGATTDTAHPLVEQLRVRPARGEGLPYRYALSGQPPPFRYFRLPTREQMAEVEGAEVHGRAARWLALVETNGVRAALGEPTEPPAFLAKGGAVHKPYGVEQPIRYRVHAGQFSGDSGFPLLEVFRWEGRELALTSELDIVALDRTRVVRPSEFSGVALGEGETLPVAFTDRAATSVWKLGDGGALRDPREVGRRTGFVLTGTELPGSLLETSDGSYVPASALRRIEARREFPSFATGDRKWIDISIRQQTLVAYVGQKPVFATLVSTGRGGMGDPETEMATVRGTFMIHHKDVSSTMNGDEDRSDAFNLIDVPFVQYFHKGFALHGAYWHDEFGRQRSHGCVNLAPKDAAWLFEWTDPPVPQGWHGVINKERGTVVHVRP